MSNVPAFPGGYRNWRKPVLGEADPAAGLRPDGVTKKGRGWLGVIPAMPGAAAGTGDVMTEWTMGYQFGNTPVNAPLLVPTLSRDEIDTLRTFGPAGINRSMIDKSVEHAKKRIRMGYSPYYD